MRRFAQTILRTWRRGNPTILRVWKSSRLRVWRSSPMADMPVEQMYAVVGEEKTFGFDFQNEGAVRDGAVLSAPVVSSDPSVTVSGEAILAADFTNADGSVIPSGMGASAKLIPSIVGTYRVTCLVSASGVSDKLMVLGDLVVTPTGL